MDFWKKLLDRFKHGPEQKPSGLLLEPPEILESLPRHELFAGGEQETPLWRSYTPPFRWQGASMWCTAFAGCSIGSIFQAKEGGNLVVFSPLELFYRSGGSPNGNYLINTARAMQESIVLENAIPTPQPNYWNFTEWERYKGLSKATPGMLDQGEPYKTKSHATVQTDWKSMRRALQTSPLMLAVGIGRGYFDPIAKKQSKYSAYHAVVCTDMVESPSGEPLYIEIFDSLTQTKDFDGFHKLAADYEVILALSFIDLPNEWKEIQENAKPLNALNQYGKKRVLSLEQQMAHLLVSTLESHPSVRGLAGREWLVAVNALSYGGYSVTDLLNHWTSIRRGQGAIWDLNQVREMGRIQK